MTDAHIYVIGILLAWMAGIRAYLTVFGVGLAGLLGWVDLPPALEPTTPPAVPAAASPAAVSSNNSVGSAP